MQYSEEIDLSNYQITICRKLQSYHGARQRDLLFTLPTIHAMVQNTMILWMIFLLEILTA